MTKRAGTALIALIGLIGLLHWSARFDLRGPGSLSGDGWRQWLDDPTTVAATALRWVALLASYYLLLVVTVVTMAGERSSGAHRRLRRLVPPGLAAPVGALLGTAAVVVPLGVHVHSATQSPPTVVEQPLRLQLAEQPLRLSPVEVDSDPYAERNRPSSDPRVIPQIEDDEPELWPVVHGDHLWSIAESTLEDVWGRTDLADDEVAGYWRQVIAANEDRFVEPGNPDLILPGQDMVLPQPPPDPARPS